METPNTNLQTSQAKQNTIMLYFSIVIILITLAYFFCISFITVPDKNRDFANIVLGFMAGTGFSNIINFYFGSSKGSRDKDASNTQLAADSQIVKQPDASQNT